ncbi:MAG TPA: hypothetical protein VM680_18460 [Verrucomicrobiae bacterium]|nr:hypothetical protein [Verrucomicrobiae bacterium]
MNSGLKTTILEGSIPIAKALATTWDLEALRQLWLQANETNNPERADMISHRMDVIRGS